MMDNHGPGLQVKQFLVVKGGETVYDERFHPGVNIIRGDNSTGKSTIMDLLFYGLGGDFFAWKAEAIACDFVVVEAEFNAQIVTLRREIAKRGKQPMWIFLGPIDEANENADRWLRYGYTRSPERESFSQALFRLLNVPDISAEDESNITIHQIFRLLYADQITPVTRIFRMEQFDTPQRRQAVGDFMLGVYDSRIYLNQIALREKQREYDNVSSDLSNVYRVLGESGESLNADFLSEVEANTQVRIRQNQILIEAIREKRSAEISNTRDIDDKVIESLRHDIGRLSEEVEVIKNRITMTEFAIEDSKVFIAELRRNLSQISAGFQTREVIGGIDFSFCPACYAPIQEPRAEGQCHLCKTPLEEETGKARYARARNEIEMQIRESDHLVELKAERRSEDRTQLAKLQALRQGLQREYQTLTANFVSEHDAELEQAIAERGYLRRKLEEISEKWDRLRFVQELQENKAALNSEISGLKDEISRLEMQAKSRRQRAVTLIQDSTAYILQKDLRSEIEFAEQPQVKFSFWDDYISVDGKTSFSASSLTVLRNAFHLGLLWASTVDQGMNYPRFLMMDNVEDKGMTQERSYNFQRLICHVSENCSASHQIIFSTSMIDPDLNETNFVVGDYYTFDKKALRVG